MFVQGYDTHPIQCNPKPNCCCTLRKKKARRIAVYTNNLERSLPDGRTPMESWAGAVKIVFRARDPTTATKHHTEVTHHGAPWAPPDKQNSSQPVGRNIATTLATLITHQDWRKLTRHGPYHTCRAWSRACLSPPSYRCQQQKARTPTVYRNTLSSVANTASHHGGRGSSTFMYPDEGNALALSY